MKWQPAGRKMAQRFPMGSGNFYLDYKTLKLSQKICVLFINLNVLSTQHDFSIDIIFVSSLMKKQSLNTREKKPAIEYCCIMQKYPDVQ